MALNLHPLIFLVILVISVAVLTKRFSSNNGLSSNQKKSSNGNNILMNIICILLATPVCFMFGVATAMSAGAPDASPFQTIVFTIAAMLFWVTPVIAIIGLILSRVFKKREKATLSVIAQAAPFGTVLLAFLLMIIGFI